MAIQRTLHPNGWSLSAFYQLCASNMPQIKCMQGFLNRSFFAVAYPMEPTRYAGKALKELINKLGIPDLLTFDGCKEQTG
jgi:hypothetical protein